MAEQVQSLASQARARLSARPTPETQATAPLRTAMRTKVKVHKSPTPAVITTESVEGRKRSSRKQSPLPSVRTRQPAAKAAPCEAQQWPSDLPMLPLPIESSYGQLAAERSPLEGKTEDAGDLSPRAITDAALLKSQLLLEQLLSLGLDISDEPSVVSAAASADPVDEDTEDVVDVEKLSTWAWPAQPADQTTVQVPVKFMEMLGEMWEQIKENQERGKIVPDMASGHADLGKSYDDLDQVSSCSTRLSPSCSNLSSPGCSTPTLSPGRSASSVGSPAQYCSLSPEDKAQLIQELKEVLCTRSLSKATSSPILGLGARNATSIPSAVSPLRVQAMPPSSVVSPRQIHVLPLPRCVSLAPTYFASGLPAGRLAWQPVAVTTIHHVLAAR